MRILVTGGNGQLGTSLGKVLSGHNVLLTDTDNMDITNPEVIETVFADFRPEVLVHGAAYTNVDGCEQDPKIAEAVNAQGTRNLAEACKKHGTKMIYISTDYVFDGSQEAPYLPDSQTGPISVYGESKLAGEKATVEVPSHWILRTSWVYGEGSNFIRIILGLSETREEISVVGDQWGRPTWSDDLARAIKGVVEKSPAVGTYHVTGDGPIVSWADVAKKVYELAGKSTKVKVVTTPEYYAGKDLTKIASRPAHSALDLSKSKEAGLYLADWEDSLREYLS